MKHTKRILSFILSSILILSTMSFYATGSPVLTLKKDSALTLDVDSGYIRGIWGTTTVGKLAGEFTEDVDVFSDGSPLADNSPVASDDIVSSGGSTYAVLIYGDADRTGKINLSDVAAILKSIAKWDVDLCHAAADVAMNGKVNLGDVSALLKWLAGWDVTLGDAVFPKIGIKLGGNFAIVLPQGFDTFEMEAARLVSAALDKIYSENKGMNRIITDDEKATCEILIGDTSRQRSADAMTKLGRYDWSYDVVTDRAVVIAGGDSIATYEAAAAFVWDLFGYVDRNNVVSSYNKWNGSEYVGVTTSSTVTTGTKYTYTHTDSDRDITVGGRDITEYVIVDKFGDSDAAKFLRREILKATGHEPEIVKLKNAGDAPAIRLGVGKRGSNEFLIGLSTNVFAVGLSSGDIVIDVLDYSNILYAARTFDMWYLDGGMDLSEGDVKYGGIGSNLLRETERVDKILGEGATYSEIKYADYHGQPVLAYLVKVENGIDRIMMGMPGNGTAVSGVKASVMDAINAAEADGIDVIAGINADFFHIESDYSPVGLCVKDGVILKQNTEIKPWIAVMKDGTLDCGIAGEARAKIGNMKHGFGASHVMLKGGIVYQDGVGDSFGEIRHPRTAMGYDGYGNVYLLVVDGRRPKLSNGASLLDLTIMFRDFGAANAVNLDGGGSSTMIVDDDGFKIANSPSDGALRKVFNSVLITK